MYKEKKKVAPSVVRRPLCGPAFERGVKSLRAQTINQMPPRLKQVRAPRLRRAAEEEVADESDMEMETPSDERDDSEGSLADFIEHDSDEADDASYHGEEEEDDGNESEAEDESEADDNEEEAVEQEEEQDSDLDVIQQYTPAMETTMGSVVVDGVRRSMRSTRGRAPVRYVDEEYVELMLEGASHAELLQDSQSDQADEEEEEASQEEEEEEEESSEEIILPPPKRRRLQRRD